MSEHISNHKKNILKRAEELFLQFSYDFVSMNKIAQKTGLTKAALYYHFKNKEDLFAEVVSHSAHNFIESIEQVVQNQELDISEKFKKILLIYYDFAAKKKGLARILFERLSRPSDTVKELLEENKLKMMEALRPLSEDILKMKHLVGKVEPDIVTHMISGAGMGVARYSTQACNVHDAIDEISLFILN